MFEIKKNGDFLSLKIPSSLSEVGGAIDSVKSFFKQYKVSETLANQNSVVLRELVTNAIGHGHNFNKNLKVYVRIEHLKAKQFKMLVEDEGSGFNHSKLDLTIAENAGEIRNRGLTLVQALTERLQFNERGNCATVYTRPFS